MKKYIIGGLVGASLMFSAQSFAAVGDQVQAIFANFNLVVNGQSKMMDETPLVYNGTSYLPVRSIANIVGYDVTYKSASRTIELNSTVTGGTYGGGVPITPSIPNPPIQQPPVQIPSQGTGYDGKVFVSGKDLYQAILNDTGEMISYTKKKDIPIIIYNKKEHSYNKDDQFYDMDAQQGYYNIVVIESFIPAKYLDNIPKYQIFNGYAIKK